MGVGGLGVVDVGDPVHVGDVRDAVRRRGGRRAGRRGRPRARTPKARARAAAARALAMLCGAGGLTSATSASSWALLLPVLDEGAVDQDAVHDAELGGAGGAEGEADRPAALLDVGLAHQVLGGRVGDVVDAGDLVALVDPALVGGVRLHRAVPVEVVGGEVEHGGGVGAQRGRPVQLVAGELDGEDVVRARRRGPRRAAETPMLPTAAVRRPAAFRIDGEHPDGGGLAVGAGDREPGRRRPGPRSRQASSTSPQTGTPASAAAAKSGLVRLPAGRGDDELGALGQGRRRRRGAR